MFLHPAIAKRRLRPVCGIRHVRVLMGTLIFGLSIVLGCGSKMKLPATYPVRGKVVFRQGGVLPGGAIFFQSQANLSVSAGSPIAEDGTFELKSFIVGREASGAIAGLHRVVITPPFLLNGAPYRIPPIPDRTLMVSEGENNYKITIERK
jgi:hypothetical protein